MEIDMNKDELEIDKAIPCGLILNEIISNAFKYAFNGKKKGKIDVLFSNKQIKPNHKYRLSIKDDGIGFVKENNLSESKTLGMQLIHSLVTQLDGDLSIVSSKNKGSQFLIDF